jgi:hypothetical protein
MATIIRGSDNFDTGLGLGVGQTWQDMIGSRVSNTSYQNNTGKPIAVSTYGSSASALSFEVSVDNSTWVKVANMGGGNTYTADGILIPETHYYRINGTATISYWAELR